MQTDQVSVWVPIVVGMIGVIGVVSGQLVNAWREDRRWKRELEREELRWQRELDRESIARSVEGRNHWRDRKFDIYSALLSRIKSWRDVISSAVGQLEAGEGISEDKKKELASHFEEYAEHFDTIELIATQVDINGVMMESISVYYGFTSQLIDGTFPKNFSPDKFSDDIGYAVDNFIKAIRDDLKNILRGPGCVDLYKGWSYDKEE